MPPLLFVLLFVLVCLSALVVSDKQKDLLTYYLHLEVLHLNFTKRFHDILYMNRPSCVLHLFAHADTEESSNLAEELMELTTNKKLESKIQT